MNDIELCESLNEIILYHIIKKNNELQPQDFNVLKEATDRIAALSERNGGNDVASKLLTLDELLAGHGRGWLETLYVDEETDQPDIEICLRELIWMNRKMLEFDLVGRVGNICEMEFWGIEDYGRDWRVWVGAMPTIEQREAIPWEK